MSTIAVLLVGIFMPLWFGWKLLDLSNQFRKSSHNLRVKELAEALATPDRGPQALEKDVKAVAQALTIQGYSFLMDTYRPSKIWWESFDMLRKLALVGLVLLLGRGTTAQLIVGLVLSVGFLLLQVSYWPHKDSHDNSFKTCCDLHIFITMFTALVRLLAFETGLCPCCC